MSTGAAMPEHVHERTSLKALKGGTGDYHNWKCPDAECVPSVPSVPAGDCAIHSVRVIQAPRKTTT